jgi:hypothetical protein
VNRGVRDHRAAQLVNDTPVVAQARLVLSQRAYKQAGTTVSRERMRHMNQSRTAAMAANKARDL